ncbi:MAG TPA: cell division protein ZapB [Spirochaetia bacterium]|nr:cell division protein ZapB [Spirochaetia bacterium]
MITLEQIRLLESKITRAIELIRVLKEENSTLRKGLESAQKRMKEMEGLVESFKTDQREIESVIVRTLQHLDDLEEASSAKKPEHNGKRQPEAPAAAAPATPPVAPDAAERPAQDSSKKDELDIF